MNNLDESQSNNLCTAMFCPFSPPPHKTDLITKTYSKFKAWTAVV